MALKENISIPPFLFATSGNKNSAEHLHSLERVSILPVNTEGEKPEKPSQRAIVSNIGGGTYLKQLLSGTYCLWSSAMKISAAVMNAGATHEVTVSTSGEARSLAIPVKPAGGGSDVNGGELLMLALATCYCNDLYREAARLNIEVQAVQVEASAEFNGRGLAATNVTYRAKIKSTEPQERLSLLLRETDAVAEIHNTVRVPIAVTLVPWGASTEVVR